MSNSFPVSAPSAGERMCSNGILSWKFPLSVAPYTLIGRSRAADATSFYIPELDMLLDCGCLVTVSQPLYVFITHSHSDHCLDINRVLSETRLPQIYLPASIAPLMQDFIQKWQILKASGRVHPNPARWKPKCELIGVQSDDLLTFRNTMKVRVFDMDHSVPCCGYGFYDCRKKLKKEYENLTGKDIASLRKADRNLQVSEERMFPLFVFLGDTTATVFSKYETELFQFPLIIVECSFIDNEQHEERAADVKHMIWVRRNSLPILIFVQMCIFKF